MVRASRVIEHLRLRGESESAVRHALPTLEDAFRTASLPDAGARLICVRRLQLGQLAANASAQSVSLLIEKRFAEDDRALVHGAEGGADDAPAVWFRDALEAHEVAALKIAAGQPLDDWFWPLAIPAITAAASEERLRAIALAVASMEEAASALPAWTATLVRAGFCGQLIAALRPGDGHALMRAAHLNGVRSERASTARRQPHEAFDYELTHATADDRAVFVEVMADRASARGVGEPLSIAGRSRTQSGKATSPSAPTPDVRAQARRDHPLAGRAGSRRRADCQSIAPPVDGTDPGADAAIYFDGRPLITQMLTAATGPEGRASRGGGAPRERAGVAVRRSFGGGGGPRPQPRNADTAPITIQLPTSPWQIPDAAPTAAGGLLFLVPVLERVGFAKWAEERGIGEPEPDVLAAQVFHLLLTRLGAEEDDPAWALAAPFRLKAEGWLRSCRRYLRCNARIGLASLVLRPARLAITPTHVDAFFRLNAADVRIRRAGLDIDPGWVPWFGRVVAFHYGERPWN